MDSDPFTFYEAASPLIDPDRRSSDDESYTIYCYRWTVLLVFIFSGVANAIVLLTWAPITDKANTYWDSIGLTAINLLSVMFNICYLPGTTLALRISSKYSLRIVMLCGGLLTVVGCFIRMIGALAKDGIGSAGSYAIVLFGTLLVGLAQPFYLNMPAKIASRWFGVKERDVATTFCSLANPLGSAIGSIIPAMFVTGDSDNEISKGVTGLLITQLILAIIGIVTTFLFFQSQPQSPPSASAKHMQGVSTEKSVSIKDELFLLLNNAEYVKLLLSFTIILSNMNALATLLNQLPGDYSDQEIGLTGAAIIMSGFCSMFVTGFILDYTKAYQTILKVNFVSTFFCWIFFLSSCSANSFTQFIASAILLGVATLPISKC